MKLTFFIGEFRKDGMSNLFVGILMNLSAYFVGVFVGYMTAKGGKR